MKREVLNIGKWKALEIQLSPTESIGRANIISSCKAVAHSRAIISMPLGAYRITHSYSKRLSWVFKKPKIRCEFSSPSHDGSDESPNRQLAYYWDTAAPTPTQLRRAENFFCSTSPKLLFSATKFRTVTNSTVPEVAFLGRSNVGKSSLLNALMEQKMCHTSSKPGRTRSMNFFAVGGEDGHSSPGKLVVLDMPGYGKGSREEWGSEIIKYLCGRKQYA